MGWNKLPWLLFAALSLAISGRTEWAEPERHDEEDPQAEAERMVNDMWIFRLQHPAFAPNFWICGRTTLLPKPVPAGSPDQGGGQIQSPFLPPSAGSWQRIYAEMAPKLRLTGPLFPEEDPSSSFSLCRGRKMWLQAITKVEDNKRGEDPEPFFWQRPPFRHTNLPHARINLIQCPATESPDETR
jgi:hypothetical protein